MSPKQRARILEKIRTGRASRTERLILKQEGLCFYCHTDLDKDATKEHLDARTKGGGNETANLRVAHMLCNGVVGTLPVDLKLELHEIGRDQGPQAFWDKAREYQKKYGDDPNAYKRVKGEFTKLRLMAHKHRYDADDTRDMTPEEAEQELLKLELGQPSLSRREMVHAEVERRKQTGLPVQLGLLGWFRLMEQQGWWPAPCHARKDHSEAA